IVHHDGNTVAATFRFGKNGPRTLKRAIAIAQEKQYARSGLDYQIQLSVAIKVRNHRTQSAENTVCRPLWKVPSPFPRKICTPSLGSAVAKSSFPSPLKSPTTRPGHVRNDPYFPLVRKVPFPLLNFTLTLAGFGYVPAVKIKSSLPSLLKSPT